MHRKESRCLSLLFCFDLYYPYSYTQLQSNRLLQECRMHQPLQYRNNETTGIGKIGQRSLSEWKYICESTSRIRVNYHQVSNEKHENYLSNPFIFFILVKVIWIIFRKSEPERAKMAAKPPIFASFHEKFDRNI